MNEEARIGSNLREIRITQGLTQAQLGQLVEVSRQTINYIENGTYCPSTYLALRLAASLRVSVDSLFYLKEAAE